MRGEGGCEWAREGRRFYRPLLRGVGVFLIVGPLCPWVCLVGRLGYTRPRGGKASLCSFGSALRYFFLLVSFCRIFMVVRAGRRRSVHTYAHTLTNGSSWEGANTGRLHVGTWGTGICGKGINHWGDDNIRTMEKSGRREKECHNRHGGTRGACVRGMMRETGERGRATIWVRVGT